VITQQHTYIKSKTCCQSIQFFEVAKHLRFCLFRRPRSRHIVCTDCMGKQNLRKTCFCSFIFYNFWPTFLHCICQFQVKFDYVINNCWRKSLETLSCVGQLIFYSQKVFFPLSSKLRSLRIRLAVRSPSF